MDAMFREETVRLVWILVEHFDRESDEVVIRGVYDSLEKAQRAMEKRFPGYAQDPEVQEDYENGLYAPTELWYYADPDDASGSDRAMIMVQEVE